MIIFDYDKHLKSIKDNGVCATDSRANEKIDFLLKDMIYNSTYKKGAIIKKVKSIASDYYRGLSDELVTGELLKLYDQIKMSGYDKTKTGKKILTLYRSEMDKIISLKDDSLQRLAFASLVAFKYYSHHRVFDSVEYYKHVDECMSDIYVLAGFDNCSGSTRNKLQNKLSELGFVKYWIKVNEHYQYQPDWISFTTFSVPYCVEVKGTQDDEEIYMQMINYDDVMLYLRSYKGDEDVATCECCGTPILKSGNGKRFCSDCADIRKKVSDKKRYNLKKAV